jgi:hypothetical protein
MPQYDGEHRVDLESCDRKSLDTVLDLVPELRICALALHRLKSRKVGFPISSANDVSRLLDDGEENGKKFGRHDISREGVQKYMTPELFPISDEEELARAIYIALLRCSEGSPNSSLNSTNRESPPDWVLKATTHK